ncbi:trans-sulfuration enzyme family protein [Deinococcus peraridilitoris]|uniref:Cystathionine beta-lyase/cystathionine gamma-synthase n=1 Tax=Deinococcus peraridilitoris (strain DSM 19664 / LMG 22246 / CIP 109416 / KR-200) TaxID=937777 RepID=L0A5D3_DEIPD|nr:aminotransferase class I/II-fold pyridoxal phosphate-dependent enzyme [Deinococcus peraridilitoris]AFZ68629.1 cystathionine beta-lyase/cystathionine gamma-synthase [Deinococcus peraridilitoris DSM 19664]
MPYDLTTLAARADENAQENSSRSLVQPIYQSTVYAFSDLDDLERAMSGESGAAFYYRNGTPNRSTLERAIAALEGTEDAVATSSGMSAILAGFLAVLQAGDHVLADARVYGGTYALLTEELPRLGIQVGWTDVSDLNAVEAAWQPNTRLLHLESLTNPLLTVADVPRLAELAHARGGLVSVDNTFASPAVFRPAVHGADLVSHSLAKYLNGHATAMGGVLAGSRELMALARTRAVRLGGTISGFDAWLTVQGLKTLGLRMRAHSGNAQAVADVLENHPRVRRVHFPGLSSHPQFKLAADLFPHGFGGMMSLEVEDAPGFVKRLQGKIPLAPSLADVATTLSYPWGTSHRALPEARRLEQGITPDLLRLSVGIEDVGDLLGDLEAALGE